MTYVIVVSYPGSLWLKECLESLKDCAHPVMVHVNLPHDNAYDPGGLYFARDLGIKKFFLLHDSCIVKDIKKFNEIVKMPGMFSVAPGGLMLIGKYELNRLPPLPPKPGNKYDAIMVELEYKATIPWDYILDESFTDGGVFGEKHGRTNMIIENDWLIKYKGCWHIDMVKR